MSKHTQKVEDAILDNWMKYRNNARASHALENARHYHAVLGLLNRSHDLEEAKRTTHFLMRFYAKEAVSLVKGGSK